MARTGSPKHDASDLLSVDREAMRPLAERMRPRTLDEMVGQKRLLAPGSALRRAVESGRVHSMILWGPPGCGKTTLALLVAQYADSHFQAISAVLSGLAEVRKALKDVVIVAKAPSEGYGVAQLHWLVGDGRESIVIECQADGMHVYDDGLDVLTNQPPFPWHTENVRNYMHIETAHPEPVAAAAC